MSQAPLRPTAGGAEVPITRASPAERVVLEDTVSPEQIEYYHDADGIHHVPKRPLDDLIMG